MHFDPLYLVVMIVSAVLSLGAQAWVTSAVHRAERIAIGAGMRGVDVAALILRARGIRGVRIEEVGGFLSDHYDPRDKVLRLSPKNFHGASVAAAGIAAHEVGHAVPHFAGRLVGEGQGHDPLGRHALRDQVGDPVRDHAGLAAARAC